MNYCICCKVVSVIVSIYTNDADNGDSDDSEEPKIPNLWPIIHYLISDVTSMPSETLTCWIPARLPRPQPVLAARALGALGSSRRARLEWRAVGPPLLVRGEVLITS